MSLDASCFFSSIANPTAIDRIVLVSLSDSSERQPVSSRLYDADAHPFWKSGGPESGQHEVGVIRKIEDLRGDFWPEEDDIDDFLRTIRRWRDEDA